MPEWRPVAGYEGMYEISDGGCVRSIPRINSYGRPSPGGIMAPQSSGPGYLTVTLSRSGKKRRRYIHHLVAEAFHGPRPSGQEVRHLDGDKLNNRASNLAWGTSSENQFDNVRLGVHYWANKTHCPDGHPLSGDNLYTDSDGRRRCRTCRRKRSRGRRNAL